MILSWISDICEFFKSIFHTFYKHDMNILATGNEIRCVHCSWLASSSWAVGIGVNKSTYCFDTSKISAENGFENQQLVIFKPWKVLWNYYVRWIFKKILPKACNGKFNFVGITWESKGPGECTFQAFKESKIQNFHNVVPSPEYTALGLLQTSRFELHGDWASVEV